MWKQTFLCLILHVQLVCIGRNRNKVLCENNEDIQAHRSYMVVIRTSTGARLLGRHWKTGVQEPCFPRKLQEVKWIFLEFLIKVVLHRIPGHPRSGLNLDWCTEGWIQVILGNQNFFFTNTNKQQNFMQFIQTSNSWFLIRFRASLILPTAEGGLVGLERECRSPSSGS